MKNKKMEVPTRPTPNVTRAYKSAQIEHGELAPFHENVAAQQGVHPTAYRLWQIIAVFEFIGLLAYALNLFGGG